MFAWWKCAQSFGSGGARCKDAQKLTAWIKATQMVRGIFETKVLVCGSCQKAWEIVHIYCFGCGLTEAPFL